jgi:hypothetical protein
VEAASIAAAATVMAAQPMLVAHTTVILCPLFLIDIPLRLAGWRFDYWYSCFIAVKEMSGIGPFADVGVSPRHVRFAPGNGRCTAIQVSILTVNPRTICPCLRIQSLF